MKLTIEHVHRIATPIEVTLTVAPLSIASAPVEASVHHELGRATVDDLQVAVEQAIQRALEQYADHLQRVALHVPPAKPLAMPPEPEERVARDLRHARAISRGARALIAEARTRGLALSEEDAVEEAARMYNRTQTEDMY